MASQSSPTTLREQLLQECTALARYALASGMSVSASAMDAIEKARFAPADQPMDMAPLVKAHEQLSRVVAPATPRALLVMGDDHSHASMVAWAGSVGLVRRMMAAAVVSVLLFIVLSMHPAVGLPTDPSHGSGFNLLFNELWWMAAAGIGASFALLRQVNEYIVARNYDPKHEPTYWIKFLLGVMAGFIMAALLGDELAGATQSNSQVEHLTVPTLAMLGGFSASAVYRIMAKIVESLENVFRSSPREEAVQREKAAQAKAGEEMGQLRVNVAAQLVQLQQELASGKDPAQLSESLRAVLGTLVPDAASAQDPAAPAATIALPNTPIVSDAGEVQPPVAPAGEAEPVAAAEATPATGESETRPGPQG